MDTVTDKQQIEGNKDKAGKINIDTNDFYPNIYKIDRNSITVYPPCETCGKTNHSAERCYIGANAVNRPLPWKSKPQQQNAQESITGWVWATALHFKQKCLILTSERWLTDRRPAEEYSINPMCSLAANSPDICGEFKLVNIQKDSTAETNENTHTPQLKQRKDVESQTSSVKETSLPNPEPLRNNSEKMKLLANKYCASITPRTVKPKPKKQPTISQLKCNGDDNIYLLTKTTSPLFGKRLWERRHGRALYISDLQRSSWKLYLPLDFVNYLITQPIWLVVY